MNTRLRGEKRVSVLGAATPQPGSQPRKGCSHPITPNNQRKALGSLFPGRLCGFLGYSQPPTEQHLQRRVENPNALQGKSGVRALPAAVAPTLEQHGLTCMKGNFSSRSMMMGRITRCRDKRGGEELRDPGHPTEPQQHWLCWEQQGLGSQRGSGPHPVLTHARSCHGDPGDHDLRDALHRRPLRARAASSAPPQCLRPQNLPHPPRTAPQRSPWSVPARCCPRPSP